MNKNAKKWVVAAWETAAEKNTVETWINLQSMLLVLQCCAGKPQESDDYYTLVRLSGERARMLFIKDGV
ncbi:MAG: hypothetical protein PHE17_15520 [Thiothrix sp.]|uniref:hypothetical protein n=1 Tax=Thiothrix sp. TaxID=1032 RepID=UPI002612D906|nr:hypothetical protein [Thiothrix sp.]MDD5394424.1 hypothetical protein [Thiothrix sp.]